jgi:GNAT superfamily N-acetyltransferase
LHLQSARPHVSRGKDLQIMAKIRRSQPRDRTAILNLMAEARGDGLTEDEKSRQGFVQGAMNEDILKRLEDGPGIFIAEIGRELAGFAMTAQKHQVAHNRPAIRALGEAEAADPHLGRFLYGPIAVARDYQGQGLLSGLLEALCTHLITAFDQGVAFVEMANKKSLSVHRHYGMAELPVFEIDGRQYIPFVFSPRLFLRPEADT